MAHRTRILLIEHDTTLRHSVQALLEDAGYDVEPAASAAEALEVLGRDSAIAVVVSDVPENMDPVGVLERLRTAKPDLPILWMGPERAAHAVAGVDPEGVAFVSLPIDPDELRRRVRRLARIAPASDPARRQHVADPVDRVVGESQAMTTLRESIARVAAVDSTVLIVGETGTGKDLVARQIHEASARREHPFVTINCSAMPGELLEAELFGHERLGVTTEAGSGHGRLEDAARGTVYLDEVGDLPPALQARMLRFVHDRSVRRVGGLRGHVVDARVIAATQRSLPDAIAAGEFRSDLFFRLAAVPLELPPLRAHVEDIPALCVHLLARLAVRLRKPVLTLAPPTLEALSHYTFPGNVRELENLLERALVLGGGDETKRQLEIADLPDYVISAQAPPAASLPLDGGFTRLNTLQRDMERDLIARAIRRWPQLSNTQIAQRLGTNRRILELRMKQYGLSKRPRPSLGDQPR